MMHPFPEISTMARNVFTFLSFGFKKHILLQVRYVL